MKDNEKKVNKAEEQGVELTEKELEQVTGGMSNLLYAEDGGLAAICQGYLNSAEIDIKKALKEASGAGAKVAK